MASVPTGPATYGMEIYQQNDQPSANRFLEPQIPAGSTYGINAPMTPFSPTPDEFQNHSQKRSRVDSTVFDGPAQSRGFCHTNIILTDAATMDRADLSTVLMQIIDRCKELQLQVNEMEVNNMMAKIAFDSQVETLTQSLEEAKLATNMAPENKKTTKRDKAVKDAVHAQAHALMDVKLTRNAETNNMELILPAPLGADVEARIGFHNPNWLQAKPFQDPINQLFVGAIVDQVVTNARATNPWNIKKDDLDDQKHVNITGAAEQYMITLISKYETQVGHGKAQEKHLAKKDNSRMAGRKRTKLLRRTGAVQEFEKTHNLTGVAAMLDKEWMSSEDEGPGNVTQEVWDKEANKVRTRGNTPLEVRLLSWRSKKLTRMYYALDKLGWQHTKATNPRFHGFNENMNNNRPGGKKHVMKCMVNESWLLGNTIKFNTSKPLFDFEALVINDEELDAEDLAALADAEDED